MTPIDFWKRPAMIPFKWADFSRNAAVAIRRAWG